MDHTIKRTRNFFNKEKQNIVILQNISCENNDYGLIYYDVDADVLCFRNKNGNVKQLFSTSRKLNYSNIDINNCNNFMRTNIYKDSEGKYDVSLFDVNHNLLDIDAITSGCRLASILELVGIFISDTTDTISPQWRLYQAVVYPSNNMVRGKCMIDSDSD